MQDFEGVVCMKKELEHSKHSGLDPIITLVLILAVLKVTGYISWSWLWVLSPIWLTCLFFTVVFSAILIGGRIVKGKW